MSRNSYASCDFIRLLDIIELAAKFAITVEREFQIWRQERKKKV